MSLLRTFGQTELPASEIDPSILDPYERLALWCMALDQQEPVGLLSPAFREKSRWRAGELRRTLPAIPAIVALFCTSAAYAGLAKMSAPQSPSSSSPRMPRLHAWTSTRQDANMGSMLGHIDTLFSLDWKGWRIGTLAGIPATLDASLTMALYVAMARQTLSRLYLPSIKAQATTVPQLHAWRETQGAHEVYCARSFHKLLGSIEASGVSASFRPDPQLPRLGELALTSYHQLRRTHEIGPQEPEPVFLPAIRAQLESVSLFDHLAAGDPTPKPSKPRRI